MEKDLVTIRDSSEDMKFLFCFCWIEREQGGQKEETFSRMDQDKQISASAGNADVS